MSVAQNKVETESPGNNEKETTTKEITLDPVDSNVMEVDGNQNNCDNDDNEAADGAQPVCSSSTLKRRFSETVIIISDSSSESDASNDSSVCHVESYQLSDDEAKRMRGDYSSSDEYSTHREQSFDDESIILNNDKSIQHVLTQHVAELKPRAPHSEDPALNQCFLTPEILNKLKKNWKDKTLFNTANLTLINDPFRVCLLNNFLSNPDMINNIVDDMNTLEWTRKKMDLYEFHQTTDLVNMTWQRSLKGMYVLLKNNVMKWIADITGIELTHMSASCSLYGPTDYLLVHDDLLSDRRIAFIFYVAPWNIEKKIQTEKARSSQSETHIMSIPKIDEKNVTEDTNEGTTDNIINIQDRKINTENDKITSVVIKTVSEINKMDFEVNKIDTKDREMKSDNKNIDSEDKKIYIEKKIEGSDDEKVQTKLNEENNAYEESEAEIVLNDQQIGWSKELGGALELFAMNEQKEPTIAVKQIIPNNNMFAFFKVGTDSYHQVSEVSSFDFPRLTINGWFHGPDPDAVEPTTEVNEQEDEGTEIPPGEKPHSEIVMMNQWLCDTYLLPRMRFKIQLQIEKQSEVSLEDFFLPQKYQQVLDVLKGDILPWKRRGPANQRKYDSVTTRELYHLPSDNPVRELMQILSSKTFFNFLTDCTELSLKTFRNLELQRWTSTSFTVLPPRESYSLNELDIIIYFGFSKKHLPSGTTTYLAPEDTSSEPLITVTPINNALNIVYSDEGTARFMKYVSKLTMGEAEYFYVITSSYRE